MPVRGHGKSCYTRAWPRTLNLYGRHTHMHKNTWQGKRVETRSRHYQKDCGRPSACWEAAAQSHSAHLLLPLGTTKQVLAYRIYTHHIRSSHKWRPCHMDLPTILVAAACASVWFREKSKRRGGTRDLLGHLVAPAGL